MRTAERLLGVLVGFVATMSTAAAGPTSGPVVTISCSSDDPWATTSSPTFATRTLYLWIQAAPGDSARGLDVTLEPTGGLTVVATRPAAGFLPVNWVWGPLHQNLASVTGCHPTPVLAGEVDVVDGGGQLCLSDPGFSCCVDACNAWEPPAFEGYSSTGGEPCRGLSSGGCGPYPAVDPYSWGRTKSSYR